MSRQYLPPTHHLARGMLGAGVLATVILLIWLAYAHHAVPGIIDIGARIVTWARAVAPDAGAGS